MGVHGLPLNALGYRYPSVYGSHAPEDQQWPKPLSYCCPKGSVFGHLIDQYLQVRCMRRNMIGILRVCTFGPKTCLKPYTHYASGGPAGQKRFFFFGDTGNKWCQ